jgi:hypothetical protein
MHPNIVNRRKALNIFLTTPLYKVFPENMIAMMLLQKYKPSTIATYAHLVQAQVPHLKGRVAWLDAVANIEKQAAVARPSTKRATTATPEDVNIAVGDLSLPEQRAIAQMFLTASRFSDTTAWTVINKPEATLLQFGVCKSDRLGRRALRKWVPSSPLWEAHRTTRHRVNSYLSSLEQRVGKHLTSHSFRRGAIQHLELTWDPPQIQTALTGHAPESSKAYRTYSGLEMGTIGALCLKMVRTLMEVIATPRTAGMRVDQLRREF